KKNAELSEQVIQQEQTIKKQKVQIDRSERVITEQAVKLKQYESFMEALKKAQDQEKARVAKSGIPVDEVYIGAKPMNTSSTNSGSIRPWLTGGLMVARVVLLLTTGIPI
ncbi:hypothetical protein, partial [Spirosoma migulaei]